MLVVRFRSKDHAHSMLNKVNKSIEYLEDIKECIEEIEEHEDDVEFRHDDTHTIDDRHDTRDEYITHRGIRYRRMR